MLARSLKLLVTYEAASQVSEAANFASETVSQARLLRLPHKITMTSSASGPLPQSQHIKQQINTNKYNWGKGTDDHILPLGISFLLFPAYKKSSVPTSGAPVLCHYLTYRY